MTSRHIICDITGTVFMSSLPRYLTLHPQYLCPHNPSNCDLCTTVWMTSHPLLYDILCTIHNVTSTLWVHTIVVITLYLLHSWHHTHYIRHHTHMTTQILYLPSHPLYLTLHTLYLCHQTQCINCITPSRYMTLHTICMTSHSVCMTSHEHVITSHPGYLWHNIQ